MEDGKICKKNAPPRTALGEGGAQNAVHDEECNRRVSGSTASLQQTIGFFLSILNHNERRSPRSNDVLQKHC